MGTSGTDGRATAKTVSVPKSEPTTTTLNGVTAGLTGTCPTLTLTVAGTAVFTNSATAYGGGGACADLKNGDTRSGTIRNVAVMTGTFNGNTFDNNGVSPDASSLKLIVKGGSADSPTLTFSRQ